MLQLVLETIQDALQLRLRLGLSFRREHESHAATTHAPQHPKAPKIRAEPLPAPCDQRFGERGRRPGDDGLDRLEEVPRRRFPHRLDIPASQRIEDPIEDPQHRPTRLPFRPGPQEVFLGHHLQDRTHVLRHAAMHKHQRFLQSLAGVIGDPVAPEHLVGRQKTAARDSSFRVAFTRRDAGDEFDARPDAARVLPATARSAEPLAQQGSRQDDPALRFLQAALQRSRLPRGPHADADQATQQVGRDRQARSLGNVVHARHDLDSQARSDHAFEEVGQALAAALDARRNQPARDDRRLEQP